jgi:hypothetical protein
MALRSIKKTSEFVCKVGFLSEYINDFEKIMDSFDDIKDSIEFQFKTPNAIRVILMKLEKLRRDAVNGQEAQKTFFNTSPKPSIKLEDPKLCPKKIETHEVSCQTNPEPIKAGFFNNKNTTTTTTTTTTLNDNKPSSEKWESMRDKYLARILEQDQKIKLQEQIIKTEKEASSENNLKFEIAQRQNVTLAAKNYELENKAKKLHAITTRSIGSQVYIKTSIQEEYTKATDKLSEQAKLLKENKAVQHRLYFELRNERIGNENKDLALKLVLKDLSESKRNFFQLEAAYSSILIMLESESSQLQNLGIQFNELKALSKQDQFSLKEINMNYLKLKDLYGKLLIEKDGLSNVNMNMVQEILNLRQVNTVIQADFDNVQHTSSMKIKGLYQQIADLKQVYEKKEASIIAFGEQLHKDQTIKIMELEISSSNISKENNTLKEENKILRVKVSSLEGDLLFEKIQAKGMLLKAKADREKILKLKASAGFKDIDYNTNQDDDEPDTQTPSIEGKQNKSKGDSSFRKGKYNSQQQQQKQKDPTAVELLSQNSKLLHELKIYKEKEQNLIGKSMSDPARENNLETEEINTHLLEVSDELFKVSQIVNELTVKMQGFEKKSVKKASHYLSNLSRKLWNSYNSQLLLETLKPDAPIPLISEEKAEQIFEEHITTLVQNNISQKIKPFVEFELKMSERFACLDVEVARLKFEQAEYEYRLNHLPFASNQSPIKLGEKVNSKQHSPSGLNQASTLIKPIIQSFALDIEFELFMKKWNLEKQKYAPEHFIRQIQFTPEKLKIFHPFARRGYSELLTSEEWALQKNFNQNLAPGRMLI